MRPVRSLALGGAVALAFALSGCTGDADDTPTSSSAPTTDATQESQWTVDSLAAAVLEQDVQDVDPVAHASGTVSSTKGDWDVEIDVLSVLSDAHGTDLVYVLRSPDGVVQDIDRRPWGDGRDIWNDTRSIVIVDQGGERLLPYTGYTASDRADDFCACGKMPQSVGEGDVLGALLPPLDPATTTVTIEFPGLEPLTDVPVTRR